MQVFVLGTGRSGTHWVGNILSDHRQIRATIEGTTAFKIATQAAVRPSRRGRLLPLLRALYVAEIVKSKPRHFADKSHPVVWFADEVAQWFRHAKFVGVERSPYGTVASMLKHTGVRARQEKWAEYEVPNPFLGIDEHNVDYYGALMPAEQASLRWLSHHRQMQKMKDALGDRILILNYEKMIDNFEREFVKLWEFLELQRPPLSREPRASSRDAWRLQLSKDETEAIQRITGFDEAST